MRLLVECPACRRQYDAGPRPAGSSFRCQCGHVIQVSPPRGHEARVQRCSACGAARPDGAADCPYCGATFTLHERDLDTVCPHCLALVSDRAKFCHHCGTELAPAADPGTATEQVCPACRNGHRLVSRQVAERVAVLECPRCAGFWMGPEAFRGLVERAQREVLPDGTTPETPHQVAARFGLPDGAANPAADPPGSFYRPCPACGQLMVRRNYGHASGVIIDVCREHGVWFDADELARILAWVRAGGRDPQPAVVKQPTVGRPGAPVEEERPDFFHSLIDILFGWQQPWGGRNRGTW